MKNIKKVIELLTISLVIAGIFVGCKNIDSFSREGSKGGLPKIGVAIYKYDDNFMSYVRMLMEKAAIGKAALNMNGSENDQAKQSEQVDTMITKGVKALAINLVDPKAAQGILDKAKAAKLPVIFFNKEPDASVLAGYDKVWYVGTNSAESGILQGKMIAKLWKANPGWDKDKDGILSYVLLKGEPGHPDAEARTKYVIEELIKEGIGVKELAKDTAMWDAVKATDKMDGWLSKFGNKIEFVIANNDGMALGAIASLEKSGYLTGSKFIPIVGVDAIPDAIEKIKSGEMSGTVLNNAKDQGTAIIDLAVNLANNRNLLEGTSWKLENNKYIRVPYINITRDNTDVADQAYK
ncbi:MAG: galactose/glucose ABC transporter substrate-binding protein MglB [Clostridiaceae bacterium]|nr:galactose/glucose ABC transporter substrate-binding protein MglB [Clostridiaceae bacterium]